MFLPLFGKDFDGYIFVQASIKFSVKNANWSFRFYWLYECLIDWEHLVLPPPQHVAIQEELPGRRSGVRQGEGVPPLASQDYRHLARRKGRNTNPCSLLMDCHFLERITYRTDHSFDAMLRILILFVRVWIRKPNPAVPKKFESGFWGPEGHILKAKIVRSSLIFKLIFS